MSDEAVLMAGNVAIVQSLDSSSFEPTPIRVEDFLRSSADGNGTVSLALAQSKAVVEDEENQYTDIKLLYGSWVESGFEDKQIEELYRSRLILSRLPEQ